MNIFYNFIIKLIRKILIKLIYKGLLFSFFLVLLSCNISKHSDLYTRIEKNTIDTVSNSLWNSVQHNRLVTVQHNIKEIDSFYIYERKSEITKYKCSGCHTEHLEVLQKKQIFIHKDIHFFHMNSKTASCLSCHDANNMDFLKSHTGNTIDFNASYKLCAQCHQGEYKNWIVGAHGKQVGGWMPPRISKTCVECHNPHSPKFHTKIPSYPVYLERKRN